MQRLFSMFPQGRPGLALLLLRAAVAGSMLLSGGDVRGSAYKLAVTVVLGSTLCLGFLTPIAALLAIFVDLLELSSRSVTHAHMLILILQAIALSLLGPGAYSVDAYLYGRRVVVLPPNGAKDRH